MWSERRITPYVTPERECCTSAKDLRLSEFREESPVDQFMFQYMEVDGMQSKRITSDIYMLFNQERLDRMSRANLVSYFEGLSVSEPKFAELRSKLSDEQLCSFVKSRFIQSPSELMSWSQYLMNSSDEQIAALATAQSGQTDIVTPIDTPTPSE